MTISEHRLPQWEPSGLLPVIDPKDPLENNRSPYRITLAELADRFGTTAHRQKLLLKLLDYRKALHDVGVNGGFQWINGSFVEDVENRRGRGPADIDVVTFYSVPHICTVEDMRGKAPYLFCRREVQHLYGVDSLELVPLNLQPIDELIRMSLELSDVLSFTRQKCRKGFVQITLDKYGSSDSIIRSMLERAIAPIPSCR